MDLAVVDQYGAPKYGPIGRPPVGIVFHTPENVDHTLAQAIAIARWQGTASNTSGGSYHGILGYDASRGYMTRREAWVMVRSVPWNEAAGGLTSNHTPPPTGVWAPQRYPWIQQSITPAAFADPNRWFHQIAISGKAAWYVANGYPSGLIDRLAEWVRTLETIYGYDAVLTLHRQWQTNRTDPGPENLAELVLAQYVKEFLSTPAPPPPAPLPAPLPAPTPPPPDPLVVATSRIAGKDASMREAITALTHGLEK